MMVGTEVVVIFALQRGVGILSWMHSLYWMVDGQGVLEYSRLRGVEYTIRELNEFMKEWMRRLRLASA